MIVREWLEIRELGDTVREEKIKHPKDALNIYWLWKLGAKYVWFPAPGEWGYVISGCGYLVATLHVESEDEYEAHDCYYSGPVN